MRKLRSRETKGCSQRAVLEVLREGSRENETLQMGPEGCKSRRMAFCGMEASECTLCSGATDLVGL